MYEQWHLQKTSFLWIWYKTSKSNNVLVTTPIKPTTVYLRSLLQILAPTKIRVR